MIQGNYFADNVDLQLHFDTLVDRDVVVSLYENGFTDAAPLAQSMDQLGLKFESGKVTHPQPFVDSVKKFYETGLHSIAFLRRFRKQSFSFASTGLRCCRFEEARGRYDISPAACMATVSPAPKKGKGEHVYTTGLNIFKIMPPFMLTNFL